MHLISLIHAYLFLPNLIILIIRYLVKSTNYESPSSCSLLPPPVTSSLFRPNILHSTEFFHTLNPGFSLLGQEGRENGR
jgi:hypothetical protein